TILGWLLALTALLVVIITLATWSFDTNLAEIADDADTFVSDRSLSWPLPWLIRTPIRWLADWRKLFTSLPGYYAQWMLWLLYALLVWLVLALPTLVKLVWRRIEYRRRVPLGKGAFMNYWSNTLDKVGAVYTVALRKKGIWTVHDFLVAVVRPGGVQRLTRALDVSEEWILDRARQANLMRLGGVGPTQASWLISAGVHSLAQLAQQDGDDLAGKMAQARQETVEGWIKQAQQVQDVI
ncbi:MAG: DUF4332 domain-containing protein, partial [Delftia sp.]|nr:DUF4332 domain-containing protein [Delftia sp.]